MSTYLTAPVSDTSKLINVAAPLVNPTYPIFYTLGAETIKVVAGATTKQWEVDRGIGDTQASSHPQGTAILPDTSPFGESGGDGTPMDYIDPTTATPEAIVNGLIAAGKMNAS